MARPTALDYLVRDHDEGETLADVLSRRGKLGAVAAARLFALTLAGLSALHEKSVPAGELTADCLLLTAAGKSARPATAGKQRTIKILHAGVPRYLFDSNALLNPTTSAGSEPAPTPSFPTPRPQDDLLRLGVLFYQCLTGQSSGSSPAPVCQLVPDVPEMLGELVDHMFSADPHQRPRSAAHAAKALRVFLASEEESARESRVEEHLAAPVSDRGGTPGEVEEAPEEEEPTPAPAAVEPTEGVQGKLLDLWQEVRPQKRDLVFLGSGAAGIIVLVLLLRLLTGIQFINLVCLLTGGALSFFVERLMRWREERAETGD